jgi:hypothetical protein
MDYPIYCEQPSMSGFFEPFNTSTNIAFVFAGIFLIIRLTKRNVLDARAIYLSSVLISIGIGSFLWHVYRTNLTLMLDSIPIAIFVLSFLFFYLKLVTKKILELILLFLGFFIYTGILTNLLLQTEFFYFENGGAAYFAAITYLIVLQIFNYFKKVKLIRRSLLIVFVFMMSLSFRQFDLVICDNTHLIGTHFMWHILNSITLYLMISLFYTSKN